MTLAPLLAAGAAVQWHWALSLLAMAIGLVQLLRPWGGPSHRVRGYAFALLMGGLAASSFFINELRIVGPWSPLHLLSVFVLVMLPVGILSARKGNIRRHRRTMLGLFFGGLVVAGILTLLPGRMMHAMLFGG